VGLCATGTTQETNEWQSPPPGFLWCSTRLPDMELTGVMLDEAAMAVVVGLKPLLLT